MTRDGWKTENCDTDLTTYICLGRGKNFLKKFWWPKFILQIQTIIWFYNYKINNFDNFIITDIENKDYSEYFLFPFIIQIHCDLHYFSKVAKP